MTEAAAALATSKPRECRPLMLVNPQVASELETHGFARDRDFLVSPPLPRNPPPQNFGPENSRPKTRRPENRA